MTTPTPDNAARATPVAYLTGDWRAKPCVTRSDFGGDDALMHSTAKEMRWVPLVPAATVTALEAEVASLQASLNRLSGMKFSDRMHAALVSRADAAERRVAELEGVLSSVIADASWRTSDNTLWPRLVKAMQNTGAGAK